MNFNNLLHLLECIHKLIVVPPKVFESGVCLYLPGREIGSILIALCNSAIHRMVMVRRFAGNITNAKQKCVDGGKAGGGFA